MIIQSAREERGMGIPLSDAQRLVRHYDITLDEAYALLAEYPVDDLLPERGYGLSIPSTIVGSTVEEMRIALEEMEAAIPLGGKVNLEICSLNLPTDEELASMYINLATSGFHTSYPTVGLVQGIPTTSIVLQKGSPALVAVIPLIIPALIIGLIAFSIARIESISRALLPIAIVGVVGVLILAGIARSERLGSQVVGAGTKYLEQKYSPSTEKKVLAAR